MVLLLVVLAVLAVLALVVVVAAAAAAVVVVAMVAVVAAAVVGVWRWRHYFCSCQLEDFAFPQQRLKLCRNLQKQICQCTSL